MKSFYGNSIALSSFVPAAIKDAFIALDLARKSGVRTNQFTVYFFESQSNLVTI